MKGFSEMISVLFKIGNIKTEWMSRMNRMEPELKCVFDAVPTKISAMVFSSVLVGNEEDGDRVELANERW